MALIEKNLEKICSMYVSLSMMSIHPNKAMVEDFINICNAEKLELIHFIDVVEDLKHK